MWVCEVSLGVWDLEELNDNDVEKNFKHQDHCMSEYTNHYYFDLKFRFTCNINTMNSRSAVLPPP